MTTYQYSVIPAPKRGVKAKGIKGAEAQFANALATLMNEAAVDGWEYLRAETLPAEERQGLRGRTTVYQNMLVFRKPAETEPEVLPEAPAFARRAPDVVSGKADDRPFPAVLSQRLRADAGKKAEE